MPSPFQRAKAASAKQHEAAAVSKTKDPAPVKPAPKKKR